MSLGANILMCMKGGIYAVCHVVVIIVLLLLLFWEC